MTNMIYLEGLKRADDLKKAWGNDREYHKWLKRQYKSYGTYALRDKLVHSLCEGTRWQRFRADEDGEGWRLYGFVMGEEFSDWYDLAETTDDLTDEDIDEWFEGHMAIRIHSDYDCTGRAYTQWIDWHRNPDGSISYVHQVGLDV